MVKITMNGPEMDVPIIVVGKSFGHAARTFIETLTGRYGNETLNTEIFEGLLALSNGEPEYRHVDMSEPEQNFTLTLE